MKCLKSSESAVVKAASESAHEISAGVLSLNIVEHCSAL